MIVAIAIAIALHEILAAFVPAPRVALDRSEPVVRISVATIARPATPPPRPVVVRAKTIAPAQVRPVAHEIAGASAHKEPIVRHGASRPNPPVVHSKPVWDIPTGAQGAGAGNAAGAGSVGHGGNGTGTGVSGNGSGGGAASEPCGAVYFQPVPRTTPRYDSAAGYYVFDTIKMSVHMPDGSVQEAVLDWPWRYRNEDADPFTHLDAPMIFQRPPASLRAGEPALVQYVMAHTSSDGTTVLQDCPNDR